MLKSIYPIISLIVFWAAIVFVATMFLRLIFNYADPNPFGKIGRLAYKLRKFTNRFVEPGAKMLAGYGVDTRLAPLVPSLLGIFSAYFVLQLIGNAFFILDGLVVSGNSGNIKAVIGFLLYGVISLISLSILIRVIFSWFHFGGRAFQSLIYRVTDPILLPVKRIIPPVGMFDLSAMIVLILINLLGGVVLRAFVN
jgi:YggT family protein